MNPMPIAPSRLLVLLDDAAAGARLLELSCVLAQTLQRELAVVFVESRHSVSAAALPFARVLPYGSSKWRPLSPQDMEQGFRAHAARVRAAADVATLRHRVAWSLRVMRGDLVQLATDLRTESDLLLVSGSRVQATHALAPQRGRRPLIAVTRSPGISGDRARELARQWATSLAGMLQTVQDDSFDTPSGHIGVARATARPDALVVPRAVLTVEKLLTSQCPLLLVD